MFPIVLARGIANFDVLKEKLGEDLNIPPNPLDEELHYFKNVKTHLEAQNFTPVFHTKVDFSGSVSRRAEQLKAQIETILAQTDEEKVHIIAHSMGGLDARKMIVDLGMAEKVRSLTTIGTPHFGTVLADHVIAHGGNLWMEILHKAIRINLDGFMDLTVKSCLNFNERAENDEAKNDVFYQTYASFEGFNDMFLPLVPSWLYIRGIAGRNDGLVPITSQQWKNELIAADGTRKKIAQKDFPFPADHLNQVGWWDWEETAIPFFAPNWLQDKLEYEEKVRNIYLEIARNLPDD